MTTRELHFWFDDVPPSVNSLYFIHNGRKVLSKKGRAFKNRFVSSLGGQDPNSVMGFVADPDTTFHLDVWVYVREDRLVSKGFGVDRRVKFFFKDFDASNLVKLVEDCVAELTGLQGDRNNFDVSVHKRIANGQEHVVVHLRPTDLQEDTWTSDR